MSEQTVSPTQKVVREAEKAIRRTEQEALTLLYVLDDEAAKPETVLAARQRLNSALVWSANNDVAGLLGGGLRRALRDRRAVYRALKNLLCAGSSEVADFEELVRAEKEGGGVLRRVDSGDAGVEGTSIA